MKNLDKLTHEELLKQHQETLIRLEAMRTQLVGSEKLALLGQLLAGIIHEINTPIAAIKNNVEVFDRVVDKIRNTVTDDDNLPEPSAEKILKMMAMVEQLTGVNRTACKRIHEVVQSVRSYARGNKQEPVSVDIEQLIKDALVILRHETKGRIEVHTDVEKASVKGYPGRLGQIFLNLLANACQAIEHKGNIWIVVKSVAGEVVISIRDTGVGIENSRLAGLFSDGHTTRDSGMGMGLIIVKKLIDLHKGRIEVESTPGEGTMFTIFLPSE
ncbi:MAG: sensor histidine kinase [Calditrichia bacterium]